MQNIILSPISLESLEQLITRSVELALSKCNPQPTQNEVNTRLSIEQLAKYLDCSKATIHAYINRGSIPYHKIGRRTYFIQSEVDASSCSLNHKKKGASK